MPRGSKKSANPHNNRHENGVVAPGKRILKQKSNGHLNGGSPDGRLVADNNKPTSPTATAPASSPSAVPKAVNVGGASSPSSLRTAGLSGGRSNAAAARPNAARPNGVLTSSASPGGPRKDSRTHREDTIEEHRASAVETVEGAEVFGVDAVGRQPPARAFAGSSLPLPLTVLLSCPLRDTLAMLILLLSIPPVLVTATNSIFAVMTFVPPSGSFTVLPTLSDITSSFSPTTPSFLVTCLIDVIAMSMWIWIPFPALQAFFLDAAQAMVATTLGGGSGQRPDAQDNTLVCVSMVVATHLARYRSLLLKPIQHRLGQFAQLVGEFDGSYIHSYPVESDRSWWGTFKVFLALHIFCQGMTGMVRRRLNTPRQSATVAPTTKNAEVDSAHAVTTGTDMARHTSNPHSPTDLRPRPSLQNLRESHRDKISSGKRRRKQANFVRAHQPFWAAVAATKTTIMREYETNRANADAVSSHASNADNLGNAPFMSSENNVWITEIKDTGFFFETGFWTSTRPLIHEEGENAKDEGVDRSKPLYVRCNKTDWVSMRMIPVPETGDEYRQRWVGEVYGLSAGKTYHIAFVKSDDDDVVLNQTVSTQAQSANPISPSPGNAVSPMRPSSPASPTATLKSSIASHEARLAELEDQARRTRKDNKATLSSLNRELDGLNDRLQSHSSNDDNLHARLNHLVQHKKQLDDATDAIGTELDGLEAMPKKELDQHEARRASLDKARQRQTAAHHDLSELRKANKTALDSRREQELSLRHKAERLQGRLRAVATRHTKLTDPEPMDGVGGGGQRSGSDSSSRVVDRAVLCAKYEEDIATLSSEFQLKTMRLNHLHAQVAALAQSMAQAEQAAAQHLALQHAHAAPHTPNVHHALRLVPDAEHSRPTTPELLPSSGGIGTGFGRSVSNGGGNIGDGGSGAAWYTPDSAPLMAPNGSSSRFSAQRSRRRSASGLSQDSAGGGGSGGFVFHPDDDELVPPKIKRHSGYAAFGGHAAAFATSPAPRSVDDMALALPSPPSAMVAGVTAAAAAGRDESEGSASGSGEGDGSAPDTDNGTGSGSGGRSGKESPSLS